MISQLQLFSQPSFNVLRKVKTDMVVAYKKSGLSRIQVCDRMNELADRYGVNLANGNARKLNAATLDKWLNPENKTHFPSIKALPIFCAIVDSVDPIKALLEPLGCMVIDQQDTKLLVWAQEYQKARKAKRKMRQIEADL